MLTAAEQIRRRFPPEMLKSLEKRGHFLGDVAVSINRTVANRAEEYNEDMDKEHKFLTELHPEQGLSTSKLQETPPIPIPDTLDLLPMEQAFLWRSLREGRSDHIIQMVAAFKPPDQRGAAHPDYHSDKKYRFLLPHLPVIVNVEPFAFESNAEMAATLRYLQTHENYKGFQRVFAQMAVLQGWSDDKEQIEAAFDHGVAALVWIAYQAHCFGVKQSYIGCLLYFRMLHLLQMNFPGEIWHSVRFDFNRFWAWIVTVEKRFAKKAKKDSDDRKAVVLASKRLKQGALAKDAHEDDWALPLRTLFDKGIEPLQRGLVQMRINEERAMKKNTKNKGRSTEYTSLLAKDSDFPRVPMLFRLLEKVETIKEVPAQVTTTSAVGIDANGQPEFHTQTLDVSETMEATVNKEAETVPHTPISLE